MYNKTIYNSYKKRSTQIQDNLNTYKGIPIWSELGLHQEVISDAIQLLEPGDSVLDIGCGKGALSLRLHDSGFQVTAADMDDFCECKEVINFIKSDIFELGKHENRFKAIFAIEVLEHLENPYRAIEAFSKLLVPNGFLFLSTPNIESIQSKSEFLIKGNHKYFGIDDINQSGHITPIHQFQIFLASEKNNLEIVSNKSIITRRRPTNFFCLCSVLLSSIHCFLNKTPLDLGKIRFYILRKLSK